MKKILKTESLSRKLKLCLLAAGLAGAAVVAAPRPAQAKVCPWGTFVATNTIYYSDASHTTVVCNDDTCTGDVCDTPTPYTRTIQYCCPFS